jgi:hypothetical protein
MSEIIQATGDLFAKVPGVESTGGVSMTPPPDAILGQVTGMVARAMQSIPPNARGALVGIATTDATGNTNVNLALAVKVNEHVSVLSWIGKNWQRPVEGGAAVQWVF